MNKVKVLMLTMVLVPCVASATVYHGVNNSMAGDDTLVINGDKAILSNACEAPTGSMSRIHLNLDVKETGQGLYTLTMKPLFPSSNPFKEKNDTIHFNLKKLPNGNLRLVGKPPKFSAVYPMDSNTCEFGITKVEYRNRPYFVEFEPVK